jgi:multiple antibiotic resistance protein
MTLGESEAVLMFLALIALYSPVAAVSSYIPLLKPFNPSQQLRLAIGLFTNIAVIAVAMVWVGEPFLHLLGLSTAALSATGGIALMLEAVPMMMATAHVPATPTQTAPTDMASDPNAWRSVVFMPLTFPLTIGGATVGLLIAFRATVSGTVNVLLLTVAALAYAAVTGICVYIAGHVQRRISERGQELLDRVAGILLVAIAATLLASGFTRLVTDVLQGLKIL